MKLCLKKSFNEIYVYFMTVHYSNLNISISMIYIGVKTLKVSYRLIWTFYDKLPFIGLSQALNFFLFAKVFFSFEISSVSIIFLPFLSKRFLLSTLRSSFYFYLSSGLGNFEFKKTGVLGDEVFSTN